MHGTLEVVDEDGLEIISGVDGLGLQVLQPRKRCRLQYHQEVEYLGGGVSFCNMDGSGI